MRRNLCLLLVVTLAFTAGCDRLKGDDPAAKLKSNAAAGSASTVPVNKDDDPVAKLKSHAVCLEKHLREEKSHATKADVIKDVSFDVRKTDSLVSPFVGTIRWVRTDGFLESDFEYEMTLAYQENQWILKEIQFRSNGGEWEDYIGFLARTGALLSRMGNTPPAELTDKGTILRGWSEKLVCN